MESKTALNIQNSESLGKASNGCEEVSLVVENLVKTFQARKRLLRPTLKTKAVNDVSFEVPRGTTFGLVGESGCGKTTLARLIAGAIEGDSGSIVLDGRVLRMPRTQADRRLIQMVFQDPYSSLNPRLSVGESVSEPLKVQKLYTELGGADYIAELFERIGLKTRDLSKHPHEFSGGQRQRIAIARAVATKPALVVLDEPLSALDVSIRTQIILLLKSLQKEYGLTYLFIGHDLAVVDQVADTVAVMYLGELAEVGSPDRVFQRPRHPYTRALLDAVPTVGSDTRNRHVLPGEPPSPIDPPSGCKFRTRCWRSDERCASENPRLSDGFACHHPLEEA